MKKTIAIILAALMLLSALSVMSVSAKSTTFLNLNGTTYFCKTGDTVTYTAKMKTPEIIQNGQFSLLFPGNIIEVKEYKTNEILGKPIVNYRENIQNEFRINFSEPEKGYDFTTEQFFFSVTFTVTGEGDGEIKLDKQIVTNLTDADVLDKTEFNEELDAPTSEPETKVTLSKKSASIYTKGTYQIKATVENGEGKTTYKSASTAVAKVSSSGKITGVKKGKTTISVTNNGVTKKFTITVKNPSLKKTSASIKKGKTYTIKVNGSGTFKFTSKNTKIAKVSKKGVVKGVKKGKTSIVVQANGKKLTFKVTVK